MFLKLINKFSDRNVQTLLVFVAALVMFNVAFISSNGWSRLFWSTIGYATLLATYRFAGLSLSSIGLAKSNLKPGLRYAAYVIALILLAMLLVFFVDKKVFNDPRYHHSLPTALISALILLPLKTVFFEELAFRGILPALLLRVKNQRRYATIVSSLAFGFWHIFSATKIGDYSLGGTTVPGVLVIAGVFLATSFAGYLFCELRWRSGGLAAPIAVHWFINGSAIILASLSWS